MRVVATADGAQHLLFMVARALHTGAALCEAAAARALCVLLQLHIMGASASLAIEEEALRVGLELCYY